MFLLICDSQTYHELYVQDLIVRYIHRFCYNSSIYHGFPIGLSVGTVDMEMFASLERQQKETLPVVHGMY